MTTTQKMHLEPLLVVSRERLALVFWAFVSLLVLSAVAYMWLINASVGNVVERKKVSEENRILTINLASLESRYLALTQEMTLERAHTLGFVDVTTPEYLSLSGPKTLLTANSSF